MEDIFDGVTLADDGTPLLSEAQQGHFVELLKKSAVLLKEAKWLCSCGAELEQTGLNRWGKPVFAPHECGAAAPEGPLRFGR